MITKGFVKLPRAFFASPVWNGQRELTETEAYIDMYRRAAYRSRKLLVGKAHIEINPLQFVAKTETLAKDWNWSPDQVIHFLNEMDRSGCLRHRAKNGVHFVTLSDFGDNEHFLLYFGKKELESFRGLSAPSLRREEIA